MVAYTFGIDISHHQDLGLDLTQCRRDGIQFVFLKATEGSGFVDREFAANLAEARAAGLLVCAYHYVRYNAPAAAQVANVRRVVPLDVPVIPDVEAGSGPLSITREVVGLLRAAGYRVPLTYIPRWYWDQIGRPSLAGLPPLWSSRYPDNVVGSLADEWAGVPARYWDGYGGLDVAVLQFTSSARIAGHAPLDANAYRGTREQLAALLGYTKEDDPVKQLILVREKGSDAVWVGDFITRRHIADPTELGGLQTQISQRGGDPTIQEWDDIRVLGAPAGIADVDEAALAVELAARGWDGATAAEVRDILLGAFARAAGQPEGN
jgi:lysozyme